MNMIMKKRLTNRRNRDHALIFPSPGGAPRSGGVVIDHRKGFTLVEVIVVLVILAILAAIAIPALTGYIDKAEDKKYIAMSRDLLVAGRTVLSDAYGAGILTSAGISYANGGSTVKEPTVFSTTGLKFWAVQEVLPGAHVEIAELLERKFPQKTEPGYWGFNFIGPPDSPGTESTVWNADGFFADIFPDGQGVNKVYVYVTYKVKRLEGMDGSKSPSNILRISGEYDPKAGYEVYYYRQGIGPIR
jgi:prepilin-type N-terminal cleavage/methylation domain-containing protein